MILKRLALYNFGVYAGENTFSFSLTKPIVLICGMNGRGKTTFLEAILLALYGANSTAYKESKATAYGNYLRSLVNKDAWDQRAFVELEFIVESQDAGETIYTVHREWNALSKRVTEQIDVKENGSYNEFITNNWAMFIDNIVPTALSSFYFFDGEKIAELAQDENTNRLKESVRSMLGLSVLDQLKSDLDKGIRKKLKSNQNSPDASYLKKLRDQIEELSNRQMQLDIDLSAKQAELGAKENEREHYQDQYKLRGGDVINQKAALLEQRANLQAEIDQNHDILLDLTAGELPLAMVIGLIQEIKLQAEDEHNDLVLRQSIDQIRIILEGYGTTHPESFEHCRGFVDYLSDTVASSSNEVIYDVSDYALFQLNALLESRLAESIAQAKEHLKKGKLLQHKLDEIESYLSIDIDESSLSTVFTSIKNVEDEILKLKAAIASLQQEKDAVKSLLNSMTSEYSQKVEEYLQHSNNADDANRILRYSNIAMNIIDAYSVAIQTRKVDILGSTITSCYKQLANKKNMISKIIMDANTLNLMYLDKNGNEVDKRSLSAGEKQLMVIAILWALAICSKKKLPVIIDTPLSRLDSVHRASLVKNYFPFASNQTIILTTDSEIDQGFYDMMKDSIGDEFTLYYNEETASTTIMKGYFNHDH